MGNTTYPLYIYELIQAVQKFEEYHPKFNEHGDAYFCLKQWLESIPEEHLKLADMLDNLKAQMSIPES